MKNVIIALLLAGILGTGGFFATQYIMHSHEEAEIARLHKPSTGDILKDIMQSERESSMWEGYMNQRLMYSSVVAGIGAIVGVGVAIAVIKKR